MPTTEEIEIIEAEMLHSLAEAEACWKKQASRMGEAERAYRAALIEWSRYSIEGIVPARYFGILDELLHRQPQRGPARLPMYRQ